MPTRPVRHAVALLSLALAACSTDPLAPPPAAAPVTRVAAPTGGPSHLLEGERPPASAVEDVRATLANAEYALSLVYEAVPTFAPVAGASASRRAGRSPGLPFGISPGVGGLRPMLLDDCFQGFQFCYSVNGSYGLVLGGGAAAEGPSCAAYAVTAASGALSFIASGVRAGMTTIPRGPVDPSQPTMTPAQMRAMLAEFRNAGLSWTAFYIAYYEWKDCVGQQNTHDPLPDMPSRVDLRFPS